MGPAANQQCEQQLAPATKAALSPIHSEPPSRGPSPSSCSELDAVSDACKIAYDEDELDNEDEDVSGPRRSSAASFAQQYLLQRTSCLMGRAAGPAGAGLDGPHHEHMVGKHKRKFKQLLQSIPLPHLVATSIITVIVLCLLISECKSLQLLAVANGESAQQPRVVVEAAPSVDPSAMALQQVRSPTSEPESQVLEAAPRARPPVQRRHHRQRLLRNSEQVPAAKPADLLALQQQQAAGLRREILAELMMQQRQPHPSKRHQPQQVDHTSGDTLAALLAPAPTGEEQAESVLVEVEPQVVAQQAAAEGRLVGDGEPSDRSVAHLRGSPLELIDLSGHSSRNQQQQQHHNHHTSNHHEQQQNKFRQASSYPQYNHQTFSKPITTTTTTTTSGDNNYNNNNDDNQASDTRPQQVYLALNGNDRFREFDVPQIQCNNTEEGFERFACPTPDEHGYRCLEDRFFCDGYYDCPGGEDEDRMSCMYYKLFVSHIDILTNTFLSWMKKQNRQMAHRSLDVALA